MEQNLIKSLLHELLEEWLDRELPEIIERETTLSGHDDVLPQKILAVTGLRRTGKTCLMYEFAGELLKKYKRKQIIYLNFEDERIPETTDVLTQLLPAITEAFGKPPLYLFLDEIQNIPDWGKWLRRIHDSTSIKLVVSGSSSKLSSHEIPTQLRGRALEIEVCPLTLREFLGFESYTIPETLPVGAQKKAAFSALFNKYLEYGGMPEIATLSPARKIETIQSYYRTIVQQDMIERFDISNKQALKNLLKLLLNTKEHTFNKLYNNLKSMGIALRKNDVREYIEFAEQSYFLFSVHVCSASPKEPDKHPKKIYFRDNGFLSFITTRWSNNYGRLYENLVANRLKQQHKEICYWKSTQNNYEVDFVIKEDLHISQLIQVCHDLTDEATKVREIRSLINASRETGCTNLLALNNDLEHDEKVDWFGQTAFIQYRLLWKWLLGPEDRRDS